MKVCCSLLFLFMLTRPTLSFLSSPPLLHNKQVPSFQKFIKQDCPPSPNAFPFTNPKPPIDSSSALAFATSPEPIHSLFSVGTFCPQPFWLLLILLPKSDITKKIMGGLGTYCVYDFGFATRLCILTP